LTYQRTGLERVKSALQEMADGGEEVNLILARRDSDSSELAKVVTTANELDVEVLEVSDNDISRMAVGVVVGTEIPEALALVGRIRSGSFEEVLERGGLVWLLHGVTYTGNAGFSIRTAEISGADAVIIDGAFSHDERRNAERQSVRAHRFIPTLWMDSAKVVAAAKEAGFKIIAIEDVGGVEPWDCDLTGNILCIVGSERHGIPEWLLESSDEIVKLPMVGFVPSYNLQVAVSVVALEALRQRR
jgi:TrmH family RNA methyltransferase